MSSILTVVFEVLSAFVTVERFDVIVLPAVGLQISKVTVGISAVRALMFWFYMLVSMTCEITFVFK